MAPFQEDESCVVCFLLFLKNNRVTDCTVFRAIAYKNDDQVCITDKSVPQRFAMMFTGRTRLWFLVTVAAISTFTRVARAQQTQYPKPTELPNPYRLVEGWPTLPKSMNGGHWG